MLEFAKVDLNIRNNGKIKMITQMPEGDALIVIWIYMICIAMTSDVSGTLQIGANIPYTDKQLAIELNRSLKIIKLAIKIFTKYNMLGRHEDGTYYLLNFEKYQTLEKIEKKKRAKQKKFKKTL